MSTDHLEQLIFGEGRCEGCGEFKTLAMVGINEDTPIGYLKTRPDGSEYIMPAPRHGYCMSCALEGAAAGKFGRKRSKSRQKAAASRSDP